MSSSKEKDAEDSCIPQPASPQSTARTIEVRAGKEAQLELGGSEHLPQKTGVNAFKNFLTVPLLCSAQFLDIFSSSSSIIALPKIGDALGFSASELQWVVAAYTLTFASFLLVGGRISDIYSPKPVFLVGYAIVGVLSIICAVSVNPIMLLVFRAIQGIGGALTVPPAIALIVHTVPDPQKQSQALAAFGASGAVGNAVGFVLGGVLTSRVNWAWVYYLAAIMIIPLCALSFYVLPNHKPNGEQAGKKRRVDLPGVLTMTVGLILFVYAITDASHSGWGKPQIIVTLILSVVFIVAFFLVERKVQDPAVPPSTWFVPNVVPLFLYSLGIYWFVYGSELLLVEVFQDLFGWSALKASLHCIPIGLSGGTSSYFMGTYGPRLPQKFLLPFGQLFMGTGVLLYALADNPEKYWSHVLPGMIVGMMGVAIAYVGVSVTIMRSARKGEEGVVGALMNISFQLGATIGIAVMTSIQLGVNDKLPADADSHSLFLGYADAFWCLLGFHGLMAVVSIVFVR